MVLHSRKHLDEVLDQAVYDNPGLSMSRYLRTLKDGDQSGSKQAVEDMLNAVANSGATETYRNAFFRWSNAAKAAPDRRFWTEGILATPMAVGLGTASALEIGLTVQHTYGMPVIPGSALKGMCRRTGIKLRDEGKLDTAQFQAIFGTTDEASYFVFHDAWFDPSSASGKPFKRDVITVHHQDYYSSRGKSAWPTDFDDPTPVPFLVVKPRAKFFFAIDAPDAQWGELVRRMLTWSLENLGVGAKSNAGYGFFQRQNGITPDRSSGKFEPKAGSNVAPADDYWENITLFRDGGKGELFAVKGNVRAVARGADVVKLMALLSEAAQEQLRDKKRKKIQATIKVVPDGNAWKIVEIKEIS